MILDSARISVRPLGRQWRTARVVLLALWLLTPTVWLLAPSVGLSSDVAYCWTPAALLAVTGILLSLRSSASLAGARRRGKPGSVAVVDGDLVIRIGERETRFDRDAIASGWVEIDKTVLLTREGTEIAVAIAEPATGHALLQAAGVAPEQRSVRLVVHPPEPWVARVFGFAFAIVITPAFVASVVATVVAIFRMPEPGPPVAFGMVALVSGLMVRVLVKRLPSTAISIGADGILVERLFRQRLLRRADLVEAVAGEAGLVLRLRGGKPLSILASPEGAIAVARRIHEALAPEAAPAEPAASLARLDRGERAVNAWLLELRALGREELGYRRAAVDASALLELVKDGAAPPERRIAAAVVLAQRDEGAARAALRVAVDTCVDERVRGVMARAAEGEVEADEVEAAVRRA